MSRIVKDMTTPADLMLRLPVTLASVCPGAITGGGA